MFIYIMGCDYYIIKFLHIYYNDDDYLEVEIERERGYYKEEDFGEDEDADDYEEKYNEYIKSLLTPKITPITIYKNKQFNKLFCEIRYKSLVENEIYKYDKKWCEITKIIKVEERHER